MNMEFLFFCMHVKMDRAMGSGVRSVKNASLRVARRAKKIPFRLVRFFNHESTIGSRFIQLFHLVVGALLHPQSKLNERKLPFHRSIAP